MDRRAAVGVDGIADKPVDRNLSQGWIVMQVADDFSTQHPEVIHVHPNGLRGKTGCCQVFEEWAGSKPTVLRPAAGLFPAPSRSAANDPDRGNTWKHLWSPPVWWSGLLWKSSPSA